MIESLRPGTEYVVGPDGSPLTIASLPTPGTKRWVIRRKAEVVAAVAVVTSLEEACSRYTLAVDNSSPGNTRSTSTASRAYAHAPSNIGPTGSGPRTPRSGLWLVHRRRRHARSERGQGPCSTRCTAATANFETASLGLSRCYRTTVGDGVAPTRRYSIARAWQQ